MNRQNHPSSHQVPALQLSDIRHGFAQGPARIEVLRGIDLTLGAGEIVALIGSSGAGKSTLLHIAGLLETPNAGQIEIDGRNIVGLPDEARTILRRMRIGFVYQQHYLLGDFSALENIIIPQMVAGLSRKEAGKRGRELLDMMGLLARASHRPAELSGGEQQRVALARALANRPRLLLADEPTGNLDEDTADTVFQEILSLARAVGVAALIATHNHDLARRMDRIVSLDHGRLS